jgi:uncharacterized protein YhbP (UPF0306 family)
MQGPRAPATEGLRSRIAGFLASHTTLTLATVGDDGLPAAAAVFYAHDAGLNLYFLSEDHTRHARNLSISPYVAGAIQEDGQDWRSIRGLQLRGVAALVSVSGLPHAAAVYGKRFSFVGALIAGTEGSAVLSGPLTRARFWVLRPTWLRMVDNTVSFGFKEELTLDGEAP